jgi:hypothetical protein
MLLLPLTLAAAGFVLYLVVTHWQEKTIEDLKQSPFPSARVLQSAEQQPF